MICWLIGIYYIDYTMTVRLIVGRTGENRIHIHSLTQKPRHHRESCHKRW